MGRDQCTCTVIQNKYYITGTGSSLDGTYTWNQNPALIPGWNQSDLQLMFVNENANNILYLYSTDQGILNNISTDEHFVSDPRNVWPVWISRWFIRRSRNILFKSWTRMGRRGL
jgi:hypothetical protein